MFKAKTEKIKKLAEEDQKTIKELVSIFDKKTVVYIDFANVIHWQEKIGWHYELKRLKQLLDSFDTISSIKLYNGTLVGDDNSEKRIEEYKKYGYIVITKPVKVMRISIDVSSISGNSPDLLKNFIRRPLLDKFKLETIEYLNSQLRELNQRGVTYFEDLKCNFDVEIGRDMLLDYSNNGIENFILWSGDSDFADPVNQLLENGKKVVIFSTARRVSTELSKTGAQVFEINKLREFICWPRESKKDSRRSPQALES